MLFRVVLLASLVQLGISDSSFDDCPPPSATPVPVGPCNDVDQLLLEKDIVLDPLSERLKEYYEVVHNAPSHIGLLNGASMKATHIYITSTNGVRTGICTDKNAPCAIDYVFGKNGIGIKDFTAVHFDAKPSVPYPKMRLIIDKYVWLLGNGLEVTDSIQFEFTYNNRALLDKQCITVSIRDFTFCDYFVPVIHMEVNNMTVGEYGNFVVDVRNCCFFRAQCRCVEVHFENKSKNTALAKECYTQYIAVNLIKCIFLDCTRQGIICDTIGGFVVVDNRNDKVPVVSSVMYCNFTNNCFWASDPNIGHMGGAAYAGLNLYSFGCCNSYFRNSTSMLPAGDVYGSAIFLYNEPRWSMNKYTVIAYSQFIGNTLIHDKVVNCFGAGAAVYLHGSGMALVLNNLFQDNIITGVSTATGMDIAAYNGLHFIACGNTFKQALYKKEDAATCNQFPNFIGGGSIYYDPYECPPCGRRLIQFSVTCCAFYGPDWLPLEVCPGEPDACVQHTWVYGGAILVLNDLLDDYLNVNITYDNFIRCTGDVGGAIMIAANTSHCTDDCCCTIDQVRTTVTIATVYFEECTAQLYGGSIVIAPANKYDENGCCGDRCKMFAVQLIDIVNYKNWYPTSSIVISTAHVGICKFLAYMNEAGLGVFYLIHTEIKIDNFLNISLTTTSYTEATVPSIGGIFVAGKYSSLTFLENAKVFIKALGSESTYLGWGIYFDPTVSEIPVQNFTSEGAIIVNRVEANGNADLYALTINRETEGTACEANGFSACSSDDNAIRCINYCVCPYRGDAYCGICQSPPPVTPTPMPPTLPPATETPHATKTKYPHTPTPPCTPTPTCTDFGQTPVATPVPTATPSGAIEDAVDLDVMLMVDETFMKERPDGDFSPDQNAYILVSTELTGGQLRFQGLIVSNSPTLTGAPDEYSIDVPAENLSIIYWADRPNEFGIALTVFSWPQSQPFTELYLHISAKYELPSGMGTYDGLALAAGGKIGLHKSNNSNGAGFSLFGLNRLILAIALIVGTALVNL